MNQNQINKLLRTNRELRATNAELQAALEGVASLFDYADSDGRFCVGDNRTEWDSEVMPNVRAAIAKAKEE